MEGLIFYPEGHRYELDGMPLPSVSDIVAPFGADVNKLAESSVESAAERGVICHKVLELLMSGEGDPEYPSAYDGYADAIRMFLSEHAIEPLRVEEPIASLALGVAGTPDLLCFFDGHLALLDYKFVSQIDKPRVKAQLNAYRMILAEEGVFPDNLYAVQFLGDGTYRIYPVASDDTEITICLALYRLKNKKHPRGRID